MYVLRKELEVGDLNQLTQYVPNSTAFPYSEHCTIPSEIVLFKRCIVYVRCSFFFFFTICGTLLITLYIYIGINDQDYTKMDKIRYAFLCGQFKGFFFKDNLDF